MTIEERLSVLETTVANIVKDMAKSKISAEQTNDSMRQSISDVSSKIDDTLMPEWNGNGYGYFVSERVTYLGQYYRCIQSHTSQADWTPDTAVSLWVAISDPSIEWPEWKQPVGAQDAYAKGDKVSHNEKHWISDVDSNVWEPGAVGTETLWHEA